MTTRNIWTAAFIASLSVLAFGIWLQVSMARHWTRVPLPYGVNNPGLAMQLSKEPWPHDMLWPGDNLYEIGRQQYIDYGYIPSYGALFIFVGILQSFSNRRWVQALGPVCFFLTLLTVTYDLLENRAILRVVAEGNPADWAQIRPNALMKWGGAFLVVLLQSAFYLTFPGILSRLIGVAALGAGGLGLYSVIIGCEKGIGMATLPLLVAMLALPVFFWLGRRRS